LFCNYESLPASNEHPLYQFVSVKVAGVWRIAVFQKFHKDNE
jgi:hypothetical protein